MIEKIREKNKIRIVTLAFRNKFLRNPSPPELLHWLDIFQGEADFQRFLEQITQAAATSDQSFSGMDICRILLTDSATHDVVSTEEHPGLTSASSENISKVKLIKSSGFFSYDWFIKEYKLFGLDEFQAIQYYLDNYKNGVNPSREFSSSYYLKKYKSVEKAGFNPLVHYIRHGQSSGFKVNDPLVFLDFSPVDVFISCWLGSDETIHDGLEIISNKFIENNFIVKFITNSKSLLKRRISVIESSFMLTESVYINEIANDNIDEYIIQELIEVEKHWINKLGRKSNVNLRDRIVNVYNLWWKYLTTNRPKLFVVWGSTSPLSKLQMHLCKRLGIEYLIFERGHFPRSLLVDTGAQHASSNRLSLPSLRHNSSADIKKDFGLLKSYVNSINEIPYASKNISLHIDFDKKYKNVVFIGVNDLGSGISYHQSEIKEKHSLYYYSTEQAFKDVVASLGYLDSEIRLYFKPHPADEFNYGEFASDKILVLADANVNDLIERADVCVTLSTTAIAKAILEAKPVVTMSLTDVSFKNIAYEVYEPSDLVFQLRSALRSEGISVKSVNGQKYLLDLFSNNLFVLERVSAFTNTIDDLADYLVKKISTYARFKSLIDIKKGIIIPKCEHKILSFNKLPSKLPYIDIIMPVYMDFVVTEKCINAAIKSLDSYEKSRLIIINDSSPQVEITNLLEKLKGTKKKVIVITNSVNLGFSGTVNEGFFLSENSDVLLLNSDAYLPANALPQLVSAAYLSPSIATVTPMSNNAGLMSNPLVGGEELNINYVDSFVNEKNARALEQNSSLCCEIPVGHGFCLYIKRSVIDQVGILDELTFGRGYSEEIDFCMRARKLGFKNIGLLSLFVGHVGGVSFGHDSNPLKIKNRSFITQKYPNYFAEIRDFMNNDPLKNYRI
ncbi:MAG: glycosyltransferase [Methylovulum sp.]|nr:glycosyltransferase [Methylovulum sp.]